MSVKCGAPLTPILTTIVVFWSCVGAHLLFKNGSTRDRKMCVAFLTIAVLVGHLPSFLRSGQVISLIRPALSSDMREEKQRGLQEGCV
jgi:hypothetical protein